MKKTAKEVISGITNKIGLIDFYTQEAQKLEKKDMSFIISDLDETLFSREEQLAKEPLLQANRGEKGNIVMINQIGIHAMISKYYFGKSSPQEILKTMNQENSLILTAGVPEYQYMKIRALSLDHLDYRIVERAEDKILETLRYIICTLKYIPNSLIVYEDRPQYFIQYKELIEGIIGTKLHIMYVEMAGNTGYKKIEEVYI